MRNTDLIPITVVIGPTTATIIPIPPQMSAIIYSETFSQGSLVGTVTVTLFRSTPAGTIPVEAVTLNPNQTTVQKGSIAKPVLVIGPGVLLGQATATVYVSLTYAYQVGRI